jgi:site-specific DNA-methyltransferase (adenine-specific)
MFELNKIYNEDCIDTMKRIPEGSIDCMLTDIPYGVTMCEWDKLPNLQLIWDEWNRIVKPNGAFIFTCKQPMTTDLINSNRDNFKYELIWFKDRASGFLNANIMPLPNHENIIVFYRKQPTYNPQKYNGQKSHSMGKTKNSQSKSKVYGDFIKKENISDEKMPKTILYYQQPFPQIHNTQKPVNLFRYLIKTYTNENETVFDGYMGSGTTAIACIIEKRNFIGSEISKEYCKIAEKRIVPYLAQTSLF